MSENAETSPQTPSAHDVLRDMWMLRRAEAADGLADLLSSLEALIETPDDTERRLLAQSQAHQMAGVFGVFGFADLKNQMARIDIALSDASAPMSELLEQARAILSALP
jgi:hypothetical protein